MLAVLPCAAITLFYEFYATGSYVRRCPKDTPGSRNTPFPQHGIAAVFLPFIFRIYHRDLLSLPTGGHQKSQMACRLCTLAKQASRSSRSG